MNNKANLLIHDITTTKVGLTFLFVTVVALGLTLVAAGAVALIEQSSGGGKGVGAKNAFRAHQITAVQSNEKANPGEIAFYLNEKFAGALSGDGTFSPAAEPPPEGPLAILFLNPTTTFLPTTVQFPLQTFTITTDAGAVTACIPLITGGKSLWVSKDGSTYLDPDLDTLARGC